MLKPILFISEMIPFLLLLLLILYPTSFISTSNTILGKISAIVIILFYLFQDIVTGILVGLIFLCFYQTDIVQNVCKSEHFQSVQTPLPVEAFSPAPFHKEPDSPILPASISGNTYTFTNKNQKIKIQSESETVFKNQHCSVDLDFIYKKQIVQHPETIQMLFKELEFLNDKPCNPCDPNCSFSSNLTGNLVEKSNGIKVPLPLEKEERMGYNSRGKNSVEEAFEWANSWVVNKLEPYFGVGGGNTASYI
jgi:hypothetical protein